MKLNKLNKKGVFGSISQIMVGLVSVGIVAIVVFLIISQGREQIADVEGLANDNITNCQTSVGCNATLTINESVDDAISFMPIIVIAAIGAVLLGLVSMFRARRE